MGVQTWNNMGNLFKDCVESEAADLVIHMGDHAYSIGEGDERRDDAYMAAFEPVIANCPWLPIVGNWAPEFGGQKMGSGGSRLAESERGVWFLVEKALYLHTPFQ